MLRRLSVFFQILHIWSLFTYHY